MTTTDERINRAYSQAIAKHNIDIDTLTVMADRFPSVGVDASHTEHEKDLIAEALEVLISTKRESVRILTEAIK